MKKRTKLLVALLALLLFSVLFVACNKGGGTTTGTDPVFELNKTSIDLVAGGNSEVLTLNIANVEETPEWSSSDTEVATVTVGSSPNSATVRGLAEGQAVITVVAGEQRAVCTVNVRRGEYLEAVTDALELNAGTTGTIEVDTNIATLTYSSDNEDVATVSGQGVVTAVAEGTATITVKGGNQSATVTVTVSQPRISLNETTVLLTTESGSNTFQLTAETQGDVNNGDVTWETSDDTIATVDANGLVTAVGVGEATITARYATVNATCTVKVKEELLTVKLSQDSVTFNDLEPVTLTATIEPAQEGDDAKVTWSVVQGDDIVTVDPETGVVTPTGKYGTAVVRATSVKDPDAYADCEIDVPDPYADWLVVSDRESFEAAFATGNEEAKIYLAGDVDLGGAVYTTTLMGSFNGTIDGRGYELMNFTAAQFFGNSIGANAVIENLAITCTMSGTNTHGGLLANYISGIIRNCRFDVTMDSSFGEWTNIFGCNANGATISDTIVLADYSGSANNVYAGVEQMSGTWNNVYYYNRGTGNLMANGPTQKTEEQLKDASLYANWDTSIWNIENGSIPVHKNGGNIGELTITLDKETATVHNGDTLQLTATVKPDKLPSADKTVTWSSSDPETATVDEFGVVTALKEGTVTITATSAKENDKSASCVITIDEATTVTAEPSSADPMEIGETLEIEAQTNHGDIVWATSDPAVATVENGIVTAIGAGKAMITVSSSESPNKKVEIEITVLPAPEVSIDEDGPLSLEIEETYELDFTASRTDDTLVWKSENDEIATVEDGKITAVSAGTVTITVTSTLDPGASDEIEVTVQPAVVISVAPAMEIRVGIETPITVTINRPGYTIQSDDPDTVEITADNKLLGKKAGSATITVTSTIDPTKSAKCEVTVSEDAEVVISLDKETASLDWGATLQLNVSVNVPGVEWETSDDTVATVDQTGKVTAQAKDGEAVITVKSTVDPAKSASCTVTVKYVDPVIEITAPAEGEVVMEIGNALEVQYTVSKGGVTFSFTAADGSPADGLTIVGSEVTAVKAGTYTVRAASDQKDTIYKEFTVTVNEAPAIEIDNKDAAAEGLKIDGTLTFTYSAVREEDGTVTWASSEPEVATVENGVITPVGIGKTTITVTLAVDGCEPVSDSVELTVYDEATIGMTLSARSVSLGSTYQLDAQAAGGEVEWTSSNTEVATVNGSGLVTAQAVGKTIVTATLAGTDKSTTCIIEVYEKPAGAIEISTTRQFLAMSGSNQYILVNDIDFAGQEFQQNTFGGAFLAQVNGRGYSVKNLSFTLTGTDVGFFYQWGNGCIIENINFTDMTIKGTAIHGGLVRLVVGLVEVRNCYFDVNMEARGIRVGVLGMLDGGCKVNNCIVNMNYGDASTLNPVANENPRAFIGRCGAGAVTNCFVNSTALGDANGKVLVMTGTGGGAEMLPDAFKTEEQLKQASTFDSSWSASWNIADGSLPSLKSVYDEEPFAITLSASTLTVYMNETAQLTAEVTPSTWPAADRAVTWSSDDPETATVDPDTGVITPVKEGEVTITATTVKGDPEQISASCTVTVKPANAVTIADPDNASLEITQTLQLSAEATNGAAVVWSSADPAIASVSESGLVTAIGEGTVKIRAASSLNENAYDEVDITVYPEMQVTLAPEGEQADNEYEIGEELKLVGTVSRGTGTYSTDNPDVAEVDREGNVTLKAAGEATITYTSDTLKDKSASYTLKVMPEITIELTSPSEITEIAVDGTWQFGVNVSRGEVTWETSDPGKASVEDGLVTAIAAGEVTITVRSVIDETKYDSITLEVKDAVEISVELSETELALDRDATAKLTATVTNSSQGVVWSSDKPDVADVDEQGNITTFGTDGVAVITAKSAENGEISATCTVTVTFVEVTWTEKSDESMTVKIDTETSLVAAPSKGDVVWSVTSGGEFVEVDPETGVLTAKEIGTATVRATSTVEYDDHPAVYFDIEIEVIDKVIVTITNEPAEALERGDTFTFTASASDEQGVTWASSEPSVATIDEETGEVTVVGIGTTVISAISKSDPEEKATYELVIADPYTDYTAISTVQDFQAINGNPTGKFYLANDLDLGGASYNVLVNAYFAGILDGRGHEIRNFTVSNIFGAIAAGGVVKNLAVTCSVANMGGNMGLFGLEMLGTVENCRLEITFGTTQFQTVFGRNGTGTASNCVLILHNPSNTLNVFAGLCLGSLNCDQVFYCYDGGSVTSGGPTQKSEESLKQAATYKGWDTLVWNITEGEIPTLKAW